MKLSPGGSSEMSILNGLSLSYERGCTASRDVDDGLAVKIDTKLCLPFLTHNLHIYVEKTACIPDSL